MTGSREAGKKGTVRSREGRELDRARGVEVREVIEMSKSYG